MFASHTRPRTFPSVPLKTRVLVFFSLSNVIKWQCNAAPLSVPFQISNRFSLMSWVEKGTSFSDLIKQISWRDCTRQLCGGTSADWVTEASISLFTASKHSREGKVHVQFSQAWKTASVRPRWAKNNDERLFRSRHAKIKLNDVQPISRCNLSKNEKVAELWHRVLNKDNTEIF